MSTPLIIRSAHVVGITTSAFVSGFAGAASYYTLPALSHAPVPLRLLQWRTVYDLGKLVAPTTAFASSLVWSYLAYSSYSDPSPALAPWNIYALGGLLTFSIIPWTVIVMMPGIGTLMDAAKKVEKDGESAIAVGQHKPLEDGIAAWGQQNWVRAVLPFAGAAIGAWGIFA